MEMEKLTTAIIPWKIPEICKKSGMQCHSFRLVLILAPTGKILMSLLLARALQGKIGTHQVHCTGLLFTGHMYLLLEKIFWRKYGSRNIQMILKEFILKGKGPIML